MTERLYYKDSNLLEFEAEIVSSEERDGQYHTVLNRSAFYPTSGGQQHDRGFINNIEIVDVIESNDNDVLHISQSSIGSPHQNVSGQVDPKRRLRLKQQHTAQHLLSQAFYRLFGWRTESVHLGEEYGAVEIGTSVISTGQLEELEQLTLEIIFENIPIDILFIDAKEIDKIPLRKIPKRSGTIRIIKIGDYEYSACGGTHCESTAQVGLIKIIGTEKLRGRTLVKFLCGVQLYNDYNQRFYVTGIISDKLTCHHNDLPSKLEKILDENKNLKIDLTAANKELLPIKAQKIAQNVETIGENKFLFNDLISFDKKQAGQLSSMTAEIINGLVVIAFDDKLSLAVGSECNLNAGKIAKALTAKTDLKGGGNNKMAQIGGVKREILADYKNMIVEILKDD